MREYHTNEFTTVILQLYACLILGVFVCTCQIVWSDAKCIKMTCTLFITKNPEFFQRISFCTFIATSFFTTTTFLLYKYNLHASRNKNLFSSVKAFSKIRKFVFFRKVRSTCNIRKFLTSHININQSYQPIFFGQLRFAKKISKYIY